MPLLTTRAGASAGAFGFGSAVGGVGAMTAIASQALTSDTTTVTFSSIPQTYDDLVILVYEYGDPNYSTSASIRFNGDAGNNYSQLQMFGESTSFGSFGGLNQQSASNLSFNVSAYSPSAVYMEIFDYANTSKLKTSLARVSFPQLSAQKVSRQVGTWRSLSAINSVQFSISGVRNFDAGCVFSLYGVKRAA